MIMKQLFRYASTLLRSALLLGAMAFVNTQTQAQTLEQWAEMPDAFETVDPTTVDWSQEPYFYIQFNEGDVHSFLGEYGLNEVTIPKRPTVFCDAKRCKEIVAELKESKAGLLILLGDIPIAQFLSRVAEVPFKSLQEYVDLYGYGTVTAATVDGHTVNVLPLAHPRQIGALGAHSEKWNKLHQSWELKIK